MGKQNTREGDNVLWVFSVFFFYCPFNGSNSNESYGHTCGLIRVLTHSWCSGRKTATTKKEQWTSVTSRSGDNSSFFFFSSFFFSRFLLPVPLNGPVCKL